MDEAPSHDSGRDVGGVRTPDRRALAGVLTLSMGLAAYPIFALSALAPFIVVDLGISRTALGGISTTMFTTAILVSLGAGRLVDRFGPRSVLALLYTVAGLAVVIFSNAPSAAVLMLGGILVGVGQASANPATNTVIAQWVPAKDSGTMVGVKQSGVPLIQFAAGIALAPVAAVTGWRTAFAVGLLIIVPGMLLTLRVVPPSQPHASLLTSSVIAFPRRLYWLFGCMFLLALALQANNAYLPLFAFEAVGASPVMAGLLVGAVGVVGMISRVLLGRRSGRDENPVPVVAAISFVATAASLGLLLSPRAGLPLLWVSALVFAASVFGFNVVGMTIILKSVDRASTGRATGALAALMFLGFALGPILFGLLADLTGTYASAWSFVLLACAGASMVSYREFRKVRSRTVAR